MTSQEFANAVGPLIARASVPASQENAQALTAIYDIIGQLARGELTLAKVVVPAPPKE